MNLPTQTKEERDLRITKSKKEEAKQDKYAREHGIVLERDKCEGCLKYREEEKNGKDVRNYLGSRMYCGAGHAYELSNKKSEIAREEKIKYLFEMIYKWGKEGAKKTTKTRSIEKLFMDL